MVGDQFDPEGLELKHWEKISKTQFKECSMVAIRDSNCSVFPPINHENLYLPTSPSLSSSSSSSLSSLWPSDSDESGPVSQKKPDTQVEKCSELRSLVGFGVGLVRSKVLGIGSLIGWEKVWCFVFGAGIVAVVFVVWLFYLRVRQTRYRKLSNLIIKQKDEV